jgi:hypothetical protein
MIHTSGMNWLLLDESDIELRKIFMTINPITACQQSSGIEATCADRPVQKMVVIACKQNEAVREALSRGDRVPATGATAEQTTIMMPETRLRMLLRIGTAMIAHDRPQTIQSR